MQYRSCAVWDSKAGELAPERQKQPRFSPRHKFHGGMEPRVLIVFQLMNKWCTWPWATNVQFLGLGQSHRQHRSQVWAYKKQSELLTGGLTASHNLRGAVSISLLISLSKSALTQIYRVRADPQGFWPYEGQKWKTSNLGVILRKSFV